MLTFESGFPTYNVFLWWDCLFCCNGVKIGLVSTCKCPFSSFLLDFPIVSSKNLKGIPFELLKSIGLSANTEFLVEDKLSENKEKNDFSVVVTILTKR